LVVLGHHTDQYLRGVYSVKYTPNQEIYYKHEKVKFRTGNLKKRIEE
jgi:hypothetical protein